MLQLKGAEINLSVQPGIFEAFYLLKMVCPPPELHLKWLNHKQGNYFASLQLMVGVFYRCKDNLIS